MIAYNKWVFPRPVSPYIIRGLYNYPGFSAFALLVAKAKLFDSLSTKSSKVYKRLIINSFKLFSKISF